MTFSIVRPINNDEVHDVVAKMKDIQAAILMEKGSGVKSEPKQYEEINGDKAFEKF